MDISKDGISKPARRYAHWDRLTICLHCGTENWFPSSMITEAVPVICEKCDKDYWVQPH